ncbi:MAG: hypothetical protein LBD80_04660 [Tannerella sp.]|jgi:hypothetical protein|nr:hypothetical protein [Tannerella sp.]
MAESKNNVLTHGLRGKVGGMLVFRQMNGKTFVSTVPEKSDEVSEKQKTQRRKFRNATIYGKSALENPENREIYEAAAAKKGRTPFIAAVADFLNAPEIELIDLSDYTGQPGDIIKVEAHDDTLVKEVHVSIINADGSTVEEGQATLDASGYVWTYTAQQNNDNLDGNKIVVSVSDLPGNVTTEEAMNDE